MWIIMRINYLKIFAIALFTLSLFHGGSVSAQVLVEPPCATSTCISDEMIEVAHGSRVVFDDMNYYWKILTDRFPCQDAQPTGVRVHEQVERALNIFDDTLCTNLGCFPNRGDGCVE